MAVIDVGFGDWKAQQAAGELPADVTTADFCDPGSFDGTEHGTAVAEVVHDMAPGAALSLICVDSLAGLGKAKDYVLGKGIPIVNHSVGWFNTSRGDGLGAGRTRPTASSPTRAPTASCGSTRPATRADTHWSGTFTDADANGWHDFGPGGVFAKIDEGNSFFLDKDQQVCAYLRVGRLARLGAGLRPLHLPRVAGQPERPAGRQAEARRPARRTCSPGRSRRRSRSATRTRATR